MKANWILAACVLFLALALPACGGDDDALPTAGSGGTGTTGGSGGRGGSGGSGGESGSGSEALEIDGRWDGDFGSVEVIADTSWSVDYGTGASVSTIVSFSNDDNAAITQNADDAEYDPSAYNRIVWTEIADDSFYYCTTDFGLDTLEEAEQADTPADDSHPGESGCGASPWTKLIRK